MKTLNLAKIQPSIYPITAQILAWITQIIK